MEGESELVVRRSIKGKANKKKWRQQSDDTNLQLRELTVAKRDSSKLLEAIRSKSTKDKRQSGSLGFKVQTQPEEKIVKKLDKDRFKQSKYEVTSKTELTKLKKAEKVVEEQTQIEAGIKPKPQVIPIKYVKYGAEADLEAEFDLWEEDPKLLNIHYARPEIFSTKIFEVPKVLKPHAGQSYNPAYADHLRLAEEVAKAAEEKPIIPKPKSEARKQAQLLEKRKPKPRSEKERKQLEDEARIKREKEEAYQIKHFDRLTREAANKEKKHRKTRAVDTREGVASAPRAA
jgi:Nop53 (60S ribosomal biogenesis)